MSEIRWTDPEGRPWTASLEGAHRDGQTRAKTVRLTVTGADGEVAWRDWIRANPISVAFLQTVLEEGGVALDDVTGKTLMQAIRKAPMT